MTRLGDKRCERLLALDDGGHSRIQPQHTEAVLRVWKWLQASSAKPKRANAEPVMARCRVWPFRAAVIDELAQAFGTFTQQRLERLAGARQFPSSQLLTTIGMGSDSEPIPIESQRNYS